MDAAAATPQEYCTSKVTPLIHPHVFILCCNTFQKTFPFRNHNSVERGFADTIYTIIYERNGWKKKLKNIQQQRSKNKNQ